MSNGNVSVLHPNTSVVYDCSEYLGFHILLVSRVVVKVVLLLPLSLSVLFFGFRKWQPSSHQSSSHADFLTFHLALLELVGILGPSVSVGAFYSGNQHVLKVGVLWGSINLPGELLVLSLTCLDRYVAVVHPIIYLQLRHGNGIVARNVTIAIVWVLSFGFIGFTHLHFPDQVVIEFLCLLVVSLVVVCFCSAAVLRVLIRPGPGDAHGNRNKVDQTKRRAFKIVVTIAVVQLLWVVGFLICLIMGESQLSNQTKCVLLTSLAWFNVPCSLVLPVLFLQRKRCG